MRWTWPWHCDTTRTAPRAREVDKQARGALHSFKLMGTDSSAGQSVRFTRERSQVRNLLGAPSRRPVVVGLAPVAQLVRAPRLHRGCREFESLQVYHPRSLPVLRPATRCAIVRSHNNYMRGYPNWVKEAGCKPVTSDTL